MRGRRTRTAGQRPPRSLSCRRTGPKVLTENPPEAAPGPTENLIRPPGSAPRRLQPRKTEQQHDRAARPPIAVHLANGTQAHQEKRLYECKARTTAASVPTASGIQSMSGSQKLMPNTNVTVNARLRCLASSVREMYSSARAGAATTIDRLK